MIRRQKSSPTSRNRDVSGPLILALTLTSRESLSTHGDPLSDRPHTSIDRARDLTVRHCVAVGRKGRPRTVHADLRGGCPFVLHRICASISTNMTIRLNIKRRGLILEQISRVISRQRHVKRYFCGDSEAVFDLQLHWEVSFCEIEYDPLLNNTFRELPSA